MAGTSVDRKVLSNPGSAERSAIVQLNKLVTDVANIARAITLMMPGAVLTAPVGQVGTSDPKKWKTAAFSFTFRGKITAAASQEKVLTGTTHDVAATKQAWFVLTLQTDGTTFTITKAADQTIGTDVYPTAPDNEIIVSYMKITTGATGFVGNTDSLAVSGTIVTAISWTDAPAIGAAAQLASKITENSVEVTV